MWNKRGILIYSKEKYDERKKLGFSNWFSLTYNNSLLS